MSILYNLPFLETNQQKKVGSICFFKKLYYICSEFIQMKTLFSYNNSFYYFYSEANRTL